MSAAEELLTPTGVVIADAPAGSAEWHSVRAGGIGGSDAAAVLGVDPYRTALEVYAAKTGAQPEDRPPSEAAYWGSVLEPVLAEEFARRLADELGADVWIRPAPTLAHRERPWQRCNLDALVYVGGALAGALECKVTSLWRASEWRDGQASVHALVQTHHCLAVTGLTRGWIVALIGGQRFVSLPVDADLELHEQITTAEAAFWQRVQAGDPPDPDGSASAAAVLARMHPEPVHDGIEATPAVLTSIGEYRRLKDEIRDLEREAERHKQLVCRAIGDGRAALLDGEPVATWDSVTRTTVDAEALRTEQPDTYRRYARSRTFRSFRCPKTTS